MPAHLEKLVGTVRSVLAKLLYIRLPMPFAIADVRHFQRVSPGDLTVRANAKIKPVADQALALNLRYVFSYRV
jgi:hypothetical protein